MKKNFNINISLGIIFLIIVFTIATAIPASSTCPGSPPSIVDYTAYPPFIVAGVKPNLLLTLDNSASMYDLTYVSSGTYCYDNTYNDTQTYEGYFTQNDFYSYSGGKFIGGASLPASCTYRTSYVCVNISGGVVNQFVASGRFLNWLSASKFDVEKKILTGGKYDTVNRVLIGESRGCLGRRFIKELPALSGITFAIRGPNAQEPDYVNPDTQGGYTRIEIYEANYNEADCLSAVQNWISGNYGQASTDTKSCLGVAGGGGTSSGRELATFNHSLQTCWLIKDNIKRGRDLWQGVNTQDIETACTNVYTKDSILPSAITNEASGNYICTSAATHVAPPSPYDSLGSDTTGYIGKYWQGSELKFTGNENKVKMEILHFCSGVSVSEVIDPSEGAIETGEMWNIPAVVMDAGARALGSPKGTFFVKVGTATPPTGLIQEFSDLIRFGAMSFNINGSPSECPILGSNIKCPAGTNLDAGRLIAYIGDSIGDHSSGLINAIDGISAETWTPFAEAFYNAIGYFAQRSDLRINTTDFIIDASYNPSQYWCQDNYILLITDGLSTADLHSAVNTLVASYNDGDGQIDSTLNACMKFAGSRNLDDLAWLAQNKSIFDFTQNQNPDINNDNITTFVVFSGKPTANPGECNPETLMQQTAQNGGGVYQRAEDPSELRRALWEAFAKIAAKSASGTAVSVLSTTGEGEGAVYQAYFYPRVVGTNLRWLGYLQALFVDAYGNLREDTNGNNKLDNTDTDFIIKMWFDNLQKRVKVDRFNDVDKNGILDCVDTDGDGRLETCVHDSWRDTILFENVHPIWEAGRLLFSRSPDTRTIYTTVDGSTLLINNFTAANASTLRPYLGAVDNTEATNIINYIRGADIAGYRSRTRTISGVTNTWKLGDIVYSTPAAVGKPIEQFDRIYADSSYGTFKSTHNNRRNVVYVGANDGMLHAFNGGFYNAANRQFYDNTGRTLGEELWAFIPRDLLPHLKWLTDQNYTHVYYVDLKPKVADIKLSSGWKTILIGGMRYGGKKICVTDDFGSGTEDKTFRSTYFALDVTDPENPPKLLWTFTDTSAPDDLGLTVSNPTIVRIGNDPGDWFVVFGSGPTAYDGSSVNTGKIYALKISETSDGVISSWTLNSNYWKFTTGDLNAFMADPISVDVNRDYTHDVIYIGDANKAGDSGKMFRLVTKNSSSPGTWWDISTLYNAGRPITSAASTAKDSKNNLWVFFGTGRFLDTSDKSTTDQQSFYGVKDGCWSGSCSTTYSNLLDVTSAVVSVGGDTVSGVSGATNWQTLLSAIDAKDGWYINFQYDQKERNFVKPVVVGGLVAWATYVPNTDICTPEGDSYVYAAFYETGTAYTKYVFVEEKTTTPATVGRSKYLGEGAPATIAAMITKSGTVKGFAQTSTGAIKEFEFESGIMMHGFKGWKKGGIR